MLNIGQIVSATPSAVRYEIKKKLSDFCSFSTKSREKWFSELCFCILTANSKGSTAFSIQNELGAEGFSKYSQEELISTIKRHKHRFHNMKAGYIIKARSRLDIKDKIMGFRDSAGAREYLVARIKGIGYKEASHFLRNVGFFDLAILDRHILNILKDAGIIKSVPVSLSRKKYLCIELRFKEQCMNLNLNCAELDMILWYYKTRYVLK